MMKEYLKRLMLSKTAKSKKDLYDAIQETVKATAAQAPKRMKDLYVKPITPPVIPHGLSAFSINVVQGGGPISAGNSAAPMGQSLGSAANSANFGAMISNAPMWESSSEIKAIPFDDEFYIKIKKELKQEIVQEVFEEIFTQILDADIAGQKEMKERLGKIMERMGYKTE